MSRKLALAVALALMTANAQAAPVTYGINFTVTTGTATPTGSFTYDAALGTFSNFTVTQRGITFDLTADANASSGVGCSAGKTAFDIMAGTTDCLSNQVWYYLDTEFGSSFFMFASPAPLVADPVLMPFNGVINKSTFSDPNSFDGPDDAGTFTIEARDPPAPVSEPATLALLGAGLLGLAAVRRRKAA